MPWSALKSLGSKSAGSETSCPEQVSPEQNVVLTEMRRHLLRVNLGLEKDSRLQLRLEPPQKAAQMRSSSKPLMSTFVSLSGEQEGRNRLMFSLPFCLTMFSKVVLSFSISPSTSPL